MARGTFRMTVEGADTVQYGLRHKLDVYIRDLQAEVRAVVAMVAQLIAEQTKLYIRSTPARTSGPDGRTVTYNMHDDVDWNTHSNQGWAKAEAGWIHNFQAYYGYQELGFTHWISKEPIEGMFAVERASEEGYDILHWELERIVG